MFLCHEGEVPFKQNVEDSQILTSLNILNVHISVTFCLGYSITHNRFNVGKGDVFQFWIFTLLYNYCMITQYNNIILKVQYCVFTGIIISSNAGDNLVSKLCIAVLIELWTLLLFITKYYGSCIQKLLCIFALV